MAQNPIKQYWECGELHALIGLELSLRVKLCSFLAPGLLQHTSSLPIPYPILANTHTPPLSRHRSLPRGGTVVLALVGGALASMTGPNLRAVLMNVNEPETRGVAFALQTTTDDLGKGLGPFIVAWFIEVGMGST
jgi:hypothetical protein